MSVARHRAYLDIVVPVAEAFSHPRGSDQNAGRTEGRRTAHDLLPFCGVYLAAFGFDAKN